MQRFQQLALFVLSVAENYNNTKKRIIFIQEDSEFKSSSLKGKISIEVEDGKVTVFRGDDIPSGELSPDQRKIVESVLKDIKTPSASSPPTAEDDYF